MTKEQASKQLGYERNKLLTDSTTQSEPSVASLPAQYSEARSAEQYNILLQRTPHSLHPRIIQSIGQHHGNAYLARVLAPTGSHNSTSGSTGSHNSTSDYTKPKVPTQKEIDDALAQLKAAIAMARDPKVPLTPNERKRIMSAAYTAKSNLFAYQNLKFQGKTQRNWKRGIRGTGGVVVANDASGVGVADDWLLPVLAVAELVVTLTTESPVSTAEKAQKWSQVDENFRALHEEKTAATLRINGKGIRGNTERLAQHLARILRLNSVGGIPPKEPPDPGNNNDKHWWIEILGFLKAIQSASKGASRKQVMRELNKRFTNEQILEIEQSLAKAARKMGQAKPRFLP